MEVTEVQKITQNVIAEASKVVIAGEAVVEKLLVALLAGGHVLLEDRPGSGKTTLAKTLHDCWMWSRNVCSLRRI